MDAVILAGGKCDAETRAATGCILRAELPVGGKPMAQLVAESIREAINPLNTIVVGYQVNQCSYAKPGANFVDSLRSGMEQVHSENFLLAAADLPYLEAASVQEIVQASNLEMALNYPIVRIEACEERFPGVKRTTLRLREGKFTGGNIAVANKKWMETIFPILDQAYSNRKKPFLLAKQLGLSTLWRVAYGKLVPSALRLQMLEDAASRFLKAPVRAITTNRADVGTDVDSLEQYLQITGSPS